MSLPLLGKHRRGQLLTSSSYLMASVPGEEDFNDFIFQQDGTPPDFHTAVRNHLNVHLLVMVQMVDKTSSCGQSVCRASVTIFDRVQEANHTCHSFPY
jgi:hypothetical protein